MRKRAERTLKELYDLTEKISEPKITPVLKGICRIQGPVDDLGIHLQETHSDEKKILFPKDCTAVSEAGKCTVCSAPCSLCMHYKSESGFSCNLSFRAEADSCSVNAEEMPVLKSRRIDELQLAASETSNSLSTFSSHDSYPENAKIKTKMASDASDDVDMPQVLFSGKVVEEEQHIKRNNDLHQLNLHSDTQLSYRFPSGKGNGQSGQECHGDNILCISSAGDSNVVICDSIVDIEEKGIEYRNMSISSFIVESKNTVPVEVGDDNQGHETGERQCISTKSSATVDSSLLHDCFKLASSNNIPPAKSQVPSHINDVCPLTFPLSCHPDYKDSSFIKGESMLIEGKFNLQSEIKISRCTEVDTLNSSASLTSGNSPKNESSTYLKYEGSAEKNGIKGELPSAASQTVGLWQDTTTVTGCEKPSDNCCDDDHVNDLERDCFPFVAVNDEDQNMQKAITVDENDEFEVTLDDVKVCDICGDAGREDLLAICSRCSDGAEHTYCMREMLDKVPEGEWLCEECKISEMENQTVYECEGVSERLKSSYLTDVNQNSMSTSNPKQAPKLVTRSTDLDAQGSVRGLQGPQFSIKRQVDHLEEGKASEVSGASVETASLRKKLFLSQQVSSKNQDMGKVRAPIMETSSEVQSAKGSDSFLRPKTYLSSNSFKGLAPLHSPRGHFSRSTSFNSNANHNGKTLVENTPKQKCSREPTTNDLRKDGLFKSSTKATSKNTTTLFSNTETRSKKPSLQHSRIEDLRSLAGVKERNTVEKKSFSVMGNSSVRPSAAITSNYPLKFDAKSVQMQTDGKLISSTKISVPNSSEGLDADDLGSYEGKKRVLYSSKSVEYYNGNHNTDDPKRSKVNKEGIWRSNSFVDGSHRIFEIASSHDAVQSSESVYKGSRIMDSTTCSGSKLSALGNNRSFHSQRSNETERATHHSSMDKPGVSAHKTSAEQKLREVDKKGNKWREVAVAAMSKSVSDKFDTPEELCIVSMDMTCEAASKQTTSASSQRSFFVERNYCKVSPNDSAEAPASTLASTASVRLDVLSVDVSYKANSIRDTSAAELCAKSLTETLHGEPPVLSNQLSGSAVSKPPHLAYSLSVPAVPKPPLFANPLSGTAIPKLECIWQGCFNVVGTGSPPKLFFGIQAHLSNCASQRVFQVATKAPDSIQLEEVPHISSCPLQLLRAGPQEENIALFFFAKDIDSYEKSYRKLMDKMQRNDLALRGNIDGDELLIFTSNKLPANSQRWNKMNYLWGMFKGKRRYFLSVMDDKESLFSNQDFSVTPIADVSNEHNLENSLKKLSDSTVSKEKPGKSVKGVDFRIMSSCIMDMTCRIPVASTAQKLLDQVPADPKVHQGQPSFPVGSSSGIKADLSRAIFDSSNLGLQFSTTKPCYEEVKIEKTDGTYQGQVASDFTNIKAGDSLTPTFEIGVESNLSNLRKVSSTPSVSSNCTKVTGDDCIKLKEEDGEKETSALVMAIIDDDQRGNALGADLVSCESTTNRKRGRSCSAETMPVSKGTLETVLPADKPGWLAVEDESEREKACYPCGGGIIDNNGSARSSSKVHPLHSTTSRLRQPPESTCGETATPQNARSTERCFFPVDLGPVQNTRSTNIIDIPSSDDDDAPESSSPDLELALGGKSKPTTPFVLPSLFHSLDGGRQQRQPDGSVDGDEAAASLSLSLFSFPAPDKERSAT